jgi:8-oxo-dGTP pyrophosphatase MutT (NUDIX family)
MAVVRSPEDVRRLVSAHEPTDAREARAKEEFLVRLASLAHPFDEDADPVHVTASSVVVGTRGTVLHIHRRLGRWLQPGGHVDPGETPSAAALRESFEETGLKVVHPDGQPLFFHLDVHSAASDHVHLDLRYLLLAPDADPEPLPGESPEAAWFSWDAAREVSDESLLGALDRAEHLWNDHQDDWRLPQGDAWRAG